MKITDLASRLRPRERLLQQGACNLNDAELIAILLRIGTKKENVVQLANKIVSTIGMEKLSSIHPKELAKIKGIGDAKACQLVAAFELGRRVASSQKKKVYIQSAQDVFKLVGAKMATLTQEHVIGLYLNSQKRVIAQEQLFIGTLNQSLLHAREVFAPVLRYNAAAAIIVHNHPSSSVLPSDEDIKVTKQLVQAAKVLGIQFLDHVIVGKDTYFSFRSEGLI